MNIKVEQTPGLQHNPVLRVLSKKVAEGVFSVLIETDVKNPRFSQWVTGGNLQVYGVDVFSEDQRFGHHVRVFIEMPANVHWYMDAIQGHHEVRLWDYRLEQKLEGLRGVRH